MRSGDESSRWRTVATMTIQEQVTEVYRELCGVTPDEVHPVTAGWSGASAWSIRAGTQARFLKFATGEARETLVGEVDIHRRVARIYPAAPLLTSGTVGTGFAAVFGWIDGETADLSDPGIAEAARAVARDIGYHRAPVGLASLSSQYGLDGWITGASITDAGEWLDDAWIASYQDALIEWSLSAPIDGDRLVHGDLWGANLLIGRGGLHVVDWGLARVGSPDFDLVKLNVMIAAEAGGDIPVTGDGDVALLVCFAARCLRQGTWSLNGEGRIGRLARGRLERIFSALSSVGVCSVPTSLDAYAPT